MACLAGLPASATALAPRAGRAATAPSSPAAARVRIELRPEVDVGGPQVTLGEVAVLTVSDEHLRARLAQLPLGAAPRPGSASRLERAAVARWVQARTGLGPEEVAWSGATRTRLHLATQRLQGAAIADEATAGLRAAARREGLRPEVERVEVPRDLVLPAGEVQLRTRPVPEADLVASRLSVWVEVWVDGRFAQTVPVHCQAAVYGPAYVASEPLPAAQVLDPSRVAVRETAWTTGVLPVGPGRLEDLRLRRPMAAGETLTRALVEPAPAVNRGSWATLRSAQGAVALESRVEVLEDGRSGQLVRVKVPNATSAILARVTGPDRVEVSP